MSSKKFWFFSLLIFCLNLQAQIYDPISWSTSVEKVTNTEYILVTSASIEPGWHLYSQDVPPDGPIPTSFFYEENEAFELVGETQEEEGTTVNDPVFEMFIKFFEDRAEFRQPVKLRDTSLVSIEGEVEFMVCDDERCLPPTSVSLTFELRKETSKIPFQEVEITPPAKKEVPNSGGSDRGLWTIFIIAFFSGFAALLTPCVFPMIPMTVSYFTKQSKTRAKGIRNAVIYGISIVVIYVLLGSLVTLIFGSDSLNLLSTSVWFNVIFFILLVVFALSFLGAFELVLPSTWVTKVDSKADRSGFIGIFFMALALAVVSFSCTGPIVGALLVEAASKGGIAPVVGMFGFSLAIALPFAVFAAFPGWLNSLPQSGGWLNTVKVVLGFLELALAFKFLSNADLVLQLHLLEREIFLAIWIAIFGTLALYLFGKIKLPHDSRVDHISVGRLCLAILVAAFTVYLLPGLWGAPVQLISGFPPPMQYSESPNWLGNSGTAKSEAGGLPEGAEYGPHNMVAFHKYEQGMAYAKEVGKPVLIDFTGHACVNCRKMEERVWSDPQVLDLLKNEIVLISLYVDERRNLPAQEQYISETTGKHITSIGNKWSDFQISRYGTNAQPYYVLVDHNEQNLNDPIAYEPDISTYREWLESGIIAFESE